MTLEQRLARLERRNRWLTTALALVLLAVGGAVLVAAKQDNLKIVRARAFVLVNKDGKTIGQFAELAEGCPGLTMVSTKTKGRIGLEFLPLDAQGQLRLWDKEGKLRASLVVDDYSGPGLVFWDGAERPRAQYSGMRDGSVALNIFGDKVREANPLCADRKNKGVSRAPVRVSVA